MSKQAKHNKQSKQNNNLEIMICSAISKILTTPYNWSLLVATALVWAFSGSILPYSTNHNFDMVTNISSYIQYLSLAAIIYGLMQRDGESTIITKRMLRLGLGTYILSLLTVISMKNFGSMFWFGLWVAKPMSIFSFLLLIRTMWHIASVNKLDGSYENSKNNNKEGKK